MAFEVYSKHGMGFQKIANTDRMEDGEKVLENYHAGYVVADGHSVASKNVRQTDIEKDMRKRNS